MRINFILCLMVNLVCSEQKVAEPDFYGENDNITVFKNAEEFKKIVLESEEIWLVEMYVPWCSMCKTLAPEWKKTAKFLKNAINVGAINIDLRENSEIGQKFNVKTIPAIKLFGFDKKKDPLSLDMKRDYHTITDAAVTFFAEEIDERVNGKRGSKRDGKKFGAKTESEDDDHGDVVVLDDTNFEEIVMNS